MSLKSHIKKFIPRLLLLLYNRLISRRIIKRKWGSWFNVDWKRQAKISTLKEWVETYDQSWENVNLPDLSEMDLEKIRSKLLPRESLLDAGCGDGFLLKQLADCLDFTVGVDLSHKGLQRAQLNLGRKTGWIQASLEALPFKDNAFAQTLTVHTLEHILDLPKAIAELRRTTAKRLIILLPSQEYLPYTEDYHLHFFPKMEDILKYFNFGNVECEEYEVPKGDWLYHGNVFMLVVDL